MYIEEAEIKSEELYHHGILGQRWGVRRTPEQLGYGPSGSGSNKVGGSNKGGNFARGESGSGNDRVVFTSKSNGSRVATSMGGRRSRNLNVEQNQANVDKNRILKSGNAEAIFQNRHLFTNEELNSAMARVSLEMQLERLSSQQKEQYRSTFSRKLEKYGDKLIDKAVDKATDKLAERIGVDVIDAYGQAKGAFGKATKRFGKRRSKSSDGPEIVRRDGKKMTSQDRAKAEAAIERKKVQVKSDSPLAKKTREAEYAELFDEIWNKHGV